MKKEMNNKGFSLVELIIVIAIMVILVAVLAPQYLRYVEKSRVSTDTQTTVEFINAMQVAAADEDANLTTSETYTVTSAAHSDTIAVSTDLQTVLGTNIGVMDAATMTGSTYQSTAYTDAVLNLTLSYNTTRLVWEVTASTTSGEVGINGSINP
ncbi:MAG: prepilin-type N-terminal cleavage/methylation domain-containing protein [Blautia sp.]|nr:prepilin-type N-terminal cleavage/methylation domain-containing protein [Blautia sp.]